MYYKIYIKISFLLIVFTVIGCNDILNDKFEKVNTNPNEPVNVEPDLLLPYAIQSAVDRYHSAALGMEFGNLVVQYWARIQGTNQDRYIYSNSQFSGLYNGSYPQELMDFKKISQIGEEMGNPNYQAIGMIMRAWTYSVLTDSYGDIPYSEALKGRDEDINIKPKFDLQQDIYFGIIQQLEEAQSIIQIDNHEITGDILFDNNMMKWKRFANSLRFRLLMRISDKQNVAEDLQNLIDNDMMFKSNDDNATLNYLSNPPNRHPFFELPSGRQNQFRVSKTTIDYLEELNDPRLNIFADTTDFVSSEKTEDDLYIGVPNGLLPEDAANIDVSKTSRIGSFFRQAETPGIIMTFSELNFLKAEAAERGFVSGSSEEYYEKGITASFDQYNLTNSSNYISQEQVRFNASNAIQQIFNQKWIALYGQGLEAWNEWRRSGYPDLQPSVANDNADRIPVRMQYPFQLETNNRENFEEAISRQGENTINTKVWWDKDNS